MPGAWIVPSCRMTSAPLRTGSTAPRKLKRSGSSDRTLSPLTSSLASRRTSSLSSPQKMRTSSESTALMAPRSSPAARLCSATAAKAPDCRFGGREVAFERFQVVGRNCLLEGRQPQLLRLSEQSCAISRVAELPRENSGFLEPEGAAPEIGRQPSASFQGCRGDCVRATELRAFGGRFEPQGHVFVRTSRGACSVPGGTIGIIGESLGEGSMRPPPLLGGCRLLDG